MTHNHADDRRPHFGCGACIEAMRSGEIQPETPDLAEPLPGQVDIFGGVSDGR